MLTYFTANRLKSGVAALILLSGACAPMFASAQALANQSPTFELRPHCESAEADAAFGTQPADGSQPIPDAQCPTYDVLDPQTKKTAVLKEGDPLDMDLIIHNPAGQPIERFRAWIAFDSTVLEGEKIDISKMFPTPMPGETDFSASDGYIKLSGSADTPQTAQTIIVAHIRMHVLKSSLSSSPVTFYDATGTTDSHTGIFVKNASTETNVCSAVLGTLSVQLTGTAPPAATQASSAMQTSSKAATDTGAAMQQSPSTAFPLLQVQNLRLTTDGSSVFLSWDKLPSTELVGYNLYYGTISGKYIQKRSVDKNTTDITIRALPTGTTYYFSVRGVNASGQETDFSQEQGVSVGDPATSTAPLAASAQNVAPKNPKTGGTISGDTGSPSVILLFAAVCAVIGTGLAFRRQLSAKTRL
ncbi:MAG TPA: fibronectin type III domain-containing protein [Candidatus Peribacteraceae bacterium]|nr:fibronectin type III domain-containing protein [Candidatus Peribacteraceae bacterium]